MALPLAERRCNNCNKILFKGTIQVGIVEIKCKCGTVNKFEAITKLPEGQKSLSVTR
jgi:phage FluMu protein Com